jgi:hypothetical protein
MSKKLASMEFLADTKFVFRPIHRVKLGVSRNRLTITINGKKDEFAKYVDTIISECDLDPFTAEVVDIKNNDLLPPDAPLQGLATVISELIDSLSKRRGYRIESQLYHRLLAREGRRGTRRE